MPSRFRAILGALVILALCALCVRLGFWQLSRLEQRRARNAVVMRGIRQPPAPLDFAALRLLDGDPAAWNYRRVRVRGSYRTGPEILLRGRSDNGRPGVHVVTALRLAGSSRTLLVNRGWLPAPDGLRPSERAAPPAGEVEATGLLMEIPRTGDRGAPLSVPGGGESYRRLDLEAARGLFGGGVLPLYLQLAGDSAGATLPRPVPPPALDEGPHLSYALQWFGFAITGVVGLVILLLRSRAPAPE